MRSPPAEHRAHGRPPWRTWIAGLAWVPCVVLTAWLHRRCVTTYFAPDDLISLERARGLLPPYPVAFWRILSGSGYFAVTLPLFGTDPFPYHLVNLLVHCVNVALVFQLARRWSGRERVGLLASGLFATSRIYTTALVQAVGLEELLALTFTLLAFLAFDAGRVRRVLAACIMFGMALLSKESVFLLPVVLLLPLPPAVHRRRRLVAVTAMLGASALYAIAFTAANGSMAIHRGEAYETRYGMNLFHGLMTYVAWMANFRETTPDLTSGVSYAAWRTALWLVAALAVASLAARREAALVGAGIAWFVLALAAVLPFVNHYESFYLYAALPGAAIAVAGACDALVAWAADRNGIRGSPRARIAGAAGWLLATGLIVSQLWVSERLDQRRWQSTIPGTTLATDPAIRKCQVAEHLVESLAACAGGGRARLLFVTPAAMRTVLDTRTGNAVADSDEHVAPLFIAVLDGGRALRAIYPQLDSVASVASWSPAYEGFDIVAANGDGYATEFGEGPGAHLRLAQAMVAAGISRDALDELTEAIGAYPNVARLIAERAAIQAALRDSTQPRR